MMLMNLKIKVCRFPDVVAHETTNMADNRTKEQDEIKSVLKNSDKDGSMTVGDFTSVTLKHDCEKTKTTEMLPQNTVLILKLIPITIWLKRSHPNVVMKKMSTHNTGQYLKSDPNCRANKGNVIFKEI